MRAHASRSVAVLATALLFITALKHLPLSEALTLTFLAPSLVALFGRLLLGEPVSTPTMWSIAISFLGVLVVAGEDIANWRDPSEDLIGVGAALGAAVAYALSLVLLRARAQADGFVATVLIQNALLTIYLTPIAAWETGAPLVGLAADWPLALAIGTLGAAGHLLLGWAYLHAPAARIGAVEYTGLVWGMAIGVAWFGEWAGTNVIAGATMIVGGSCLLLARR
ncbi:MAG: DMT family transporter [Rhodoblastus sp.]|nr:MAG: DMT family transporter [Rhodoblastus sp.]